MIILFKYCANVENYKSFRGFGFIYIYIYIDFFFLQNKLLLLLLLFWLWDHFSFFFPHTIMCVFYFGFLVHSWGGRI